MSAQADLVRAALSRRRARRVRSRRTAAAGLRADVFFGGYLAWDDDPALDRCRRRAVGAALGHRRRPCAAEQVFDGPGRDVCRAARARCRSPSGCSPRSSATRSVSPRPVSHEPPQYWNFPKPTLGRVEGATLGLVGLGGIGQRDRNSVRSPFGMRVRAHAPHRRAEPDRRRRDRADARRAARGRRPRGARRAGDRTHASPPRRRARSR